jgi:ankyrin repeat protein
MTLFSNSGKTLIMNKKIYISILIFLITFSSIACTRSDETTPEMAQNMLKLRGFNFTEPEFFRAIKLDDAVAVKGFVQGGINPNAKNEAGETALTFAIQHSEDNLIKVLIEKADINMRDELGNAPLHLALKKEKDDIFKLLLEKKADVNIPGRGSAKTNDQTVLYIAVARNDEELIRDLLDRGADPNKADSVGSLPLVEAVLSESLNIEIVKMLIEKGADVNKRETESDGTALIFLASNKQTSAETRQEAVKLLLEKGADKSIKTNKGKTALDWAKEVKNQDVVELLK